MRRAGVLVLVLLMILLSGCIRETYSQVDGANNPAPSTVEKTPEELEREAEEQRRLEEERKEKERRLLEEKRRAELGEFYVPLPAETRDNPRVKAKGIYITGNTAGLEERFMALLDLVDATELNAVVIDVKNDHGKVTFESGIEIVKEIGANTSYPIKDIKKLMAELEKRNIYPIARIVVFRDPLLAEKRPEWAIQKKSGGVWRDYAGLAWVNPYDKNVWEYNIAIAREAALAGFREIQFDYVRFPENAARVEKEAVFPGSEGVEKDDNIRDFLLYARQQLKDYNVHLAADVFGVIATSWGDSERIGQNWEKISPVVEYICPMVYPSHYGPGYFGFPVPDAQPGATVRRALADATRRNAPLADAAVIRPWLQSFTATWVKGHISYGPGEVRQQIEEALKLGVDEFMIWNPGNRYQEASFLTDEEAKLLEESVVKHREENGLDCLGQTARQALNDYLEAMKRRKWREAYVLQSTGFSMGHDEYRSWLESLPGRVSSYEISGHDTGAPSFTVEVTVSHGDRQYSTGKQLFAMLKENGVWKVKPAEAFMELLAGEPSEEQPGQ